MKINFSVLVSLCGLALSGCVADSPKNSSCNLRFKEPVRTKWFVQEGLRGVAITQMLCFERNLIEMGIESPEDPTDKQMEKARLGCIENFKEIKEEILDSQLKEI